ncbi:Retrovirus-related Pol polyprotein from type-1 retrotransposable element R1 [Aphis craccivora]|uniref:Retrovirus-related Pol polyprotein from type-1 retrotransposable element R1 n=1 Tax=Aphis craccivora TaxID=307492 RepID=A0A6G0Y0K3_APHCR|nr:Retrovirus-related Pol polyprotein from type-1 retrotransposable element R1 [Aphis craccivora]
MTSGSNPRRAFVPPRLIVGGHEIKLVKDLRYLGVRLDKRMSFHEHVQLVAKKGTASAAALSRLMPNISGPVESQLLYAAPIGRPQSRRPLKLPSRCCVPNGQSYSGLSRAYRTVSDEAAFLLVYMPPPDLLAQERARLRARRLQPLPPVVSLTNLITLKATERDPSLGLWQRCWLFLSRRSGRDASFRTSGNGCVDRSLPFHCPSG